MKRVVRLRWIGCWGMERGGGGNTVRGKKKDKERKR